VRNPPVHTRLRAVVQAGFSPAAIAAWRLGIQQMADSLLNRARANGQIDLVADFANPLGSILIASMLGVPLYDRLQIEAWARDLAYVFELGNTPDSVQREKAAIYGLIAYFRDLTDRRAAKPGNDLIGQLIRARNTGELSDDEMLSMCLLLILAGHSTTRNIMGNSVLALMHHPDQWQLLRDEPGLVASAAEECLRYDTSGQRAGRVALTDVRLGEVTIEAGQTVYMLLGAANRDPAQFAAPDLFDIRRSPNAHLSFGLGIHHCLGARLGRAVLQVTLGSLARHFPNARLAAEPEIYPTHNLHGLKSLRLEF
jgi:cytochrome P450